jgi:4-hydroxy-2-oxoheptanedioate aldolase
MSLGDTAAMAASTLRARLRAREPVLCTFVQASDPAVCEVLAGAGFDALCLEGEHSAMGPETVQRLVAACQLGGAEVLVRVADNTVPHIAGALDAGAAGVIVPRVHSGDEAAAAARAARFPPRGERGVGPSRAAAFGRAIREYVARADDATVLAVQVESRRAVDALDEILSVEEIDLVLVGPGDLAAAFGLAGLEDPALVEIVEQILGRVHVRGRCAGMFAATPAQATRWLDQGVELVLLASDLTFLFEGATRARRAATRRPPPRTAR